MSTKRNKEAAERGRQTTNDRTAKTLASEIDWDERIARLYEILDEVYGTKKERKPDAKNDDHH